MLEHPGSYSVFQFVTPPTFAAGVLGCWMAKRRSPWLGRPWLFWHIQGQATSYIGVVTAFSFQVFPRFLPPSALLTALYWSVPALAGGWLIARTIRRWSRDPRVARARAAEPEVPARG